MKLFMSSKGYAPIFIALAVGGVLLLGTIGYAVVRKSTSQSGSGLTFTDSKTNIQKANELLNGPQPVEMKLDNQELLKQKQAELRRKAEVYFKKDLCTFNINELKDIISLAEESILLGVDLSSQLYDLAGEIMAGYVQEQIFAAGPTFLELGIDPHGQPMMPSDRDRLFYTPALSNIEFRKSMLKLAQSLGVDVSSDILKGFLMAKPKCVQLWDAEIATDFRGDDGYGHKLFYTTSAVIKDIPIYKVKPSLGLPYFYHDFEGKAIIGTNKAETTHMGYPLPGKIVGDIIWKINIEDQQTEIVWNDKVIIKVTSLISPLTGTYIQYEQDEGEPVWGANVFEKNKFEIPVYKFFRSEPFSEVHNYTNTSRYDVDVGDDVKDFRLELRFTPSKRIPLDKLKSYLDQF